MAKLKDENEVVNLRRIIPLIMLLLLVSSVSALKLRGGDEVYISEELNENLYATAGKISVDAAVGGDIMAFGGDIDINSAVDGNVHACGGDVSVNGPIKGDLTSGAGNILVNSEVDDVRIMAGNVNIVGNVAGDVLFMGGNIDISGSVGGSVAVTAGNMVINGPVAGNVDFEGGELRINGIVDGDVTAVGKKIILGENAAIKGDLDYKVKKEASFAEEQVSGSITEGKISIKMPTSFSKTGFKIFGGIGLFLIGLLFIFAMPSVTNKLTGSIKERFWKALLYGFLALILVPIACVLLLITLIGIPLVPIVILVYILALLVAPLFPAIYVGKMFFDKPDKNKLLVLLIGVALYVVLISIPIVGGLVKLVAMLLGLGVMTLAILSKKKGKKKKMTKVVKKMAKKDKKGALLILAGVLIGVGVGMIMGNTGAGSVIGLGIGFLAAFFVAERNRGDNMAKLDVKAFALGCGATFGLFMLFLGLASGFGWGNRIVEALGSVYIGFAPGLLGGIIGMLWGAVDGAIGGLIFVLIYNALAKK